MSRPRLVNILLLAGLALTAARSALAGPPVAVSPGDSPAWGAVESRCPTFIWGKVPGARSYELAVYRLPRVGPESEPVLRETLPSSATSWTPSLERCFARGGRYGWAVRALVVGAGASEWSSPALFQVASVPSAAEVEELLVAVQDYLGERGGDSDGSEGIAPQVAARILAADGGEDGGEHQAGGDRVPAAPARLSSEAVVSDNAVLPVGQQDCRAGRYENNGDGTVTDCRTGLIWLADANCFGLKSWAAAQSAAANLFDGAPGGDCGLADGSWQGFWRLPTKWEWMAMVESASQQGFDGPVLTDARGTSKWTAGDPFDGVVGLYWSATESTDTTYAWYMLLNVGVVASDLEKTAALWMWPVRGLPVVP